MLSVECGMVAVGNVECGVWNVEWLREAQCGMLSVEWLPLAMWNVEC